MRIHRLPLLAALLSLTLSTYAFGPTTKANDDSCDIALLPAATLLVPYFEVDFHDPTNQTALLSITNVSNVERIARVTLWTDFSYPVLTFNVYLTGYDVQSISLYDVIANGVIAGGDGEQGELSDLDPELDRDSCANLPGNLPPAIVARLQEAFSVGVTGACADVGNTHEHAVGYATIDLVGNCSTANPTDAEYFASDIRYDNVLMGDYQQVSIRKQMVQTSPMVHIRAIPEGGTPATRDANPSLYANRFSQTFYSRFQPAGMFNSDARQPLPSRFATRWLHHQGADTAFKIWRQSATGRDLTCGTLDDNMTKVAETVMFDDHENGEGISPADFCQVLCFDPQPLLPSTAQVSISDIDVFPHAISGTTTSGWLYLNLDDPTRSGGAGQAWVVTTLISGPLSGAMEAMALGNGCSPAVGASEASEGGSGVIGPSPNGEPEP